MNTPKKVLELVDLFHRNTDAYHVPQYNEAMVGQAPARGRSRYPATDADASSEAERSVSWSVSAQQQGG